MLCPILVCSAVRCRVYLSEDEEFKQSVEQSVFWLFFLLNIFVPIRLKITEMNMVEHICLQQALRRIIFACIKL
jgi:hypothetical protein